MTEELCHIRCIECGNVLANKWRRYQNLIGQGIKIEDALTRVGLTRYCCRMRMMNPFKVPIRSDRQIDPRDTGMKDQMETLTIATGNPPTLAPLQAMVNPQALPVVPQTGVPGHGPTQPETTTYTVVPRHGDIALPAIPQVALPAIPAPGAEVVTAVPAKVIRTYLAW